MSLDFEDFLEIHIEDLDGAWLVVLGNTSEKSSTSMQELNLGDICASFISHNQLARIDNLDSFVDARCVDH